MTNISIMCQSLQAKRCMRERPGDLAGLRKERNGLRLTGHQSKKFTCNQNLFLRHIEIHEDHEFRYTGGSVKHDGWVQTF